MTQTTIEAPPSRSPAILGLVVVVIALLTIWILGMSGVIHLAMPLVWIIPFLCISIVTFAVLWAAGLFDS